MPTNERLMRVPPAAVWDTLADPHRYADWVVGSKAIRAADPGWPAPGTRFHHTVGIGPLEIDDHSESLEARAPELLRLRVKARPVGTAIVTLELHERAGGTLVRLTERSEQMPFVLRANPLLHFLTGARNARSLGRLEAIACRRTGTAAPPR